MISRISLYVLAAIVVAAHFLRFGNFIGVALCLATPLLFLVRRHWSLLVLQTLAYAAGVMWLVVGWHIVNMRMAFGQPWLRAAAIMVAVAAVTALAGGLLRSPRLQTHYRTR